VSARFRVVALISAYNEEDVISPVLEHLIENGVEAYLLDNHSNDGTVEEASRWLGRGLLRIETFPAVPEAAHRFDWTAILRRKKELARELSADWYIHHDADEIREGPFPGLTLAEAIRWVDRLGYNAIDFRVLNFPPVDDGFRRGDDPRVYFRFWEEAEAFDRVQVKAWKNRAEAPFSLASSGGHEVRFADRRVFPIRFLLRHYPIRSQAHGVRKVFRERKGRFVEPERRRGWHVQYDDVQDESHRFLRSESDLTPFDLERVRLEMLLEAAEPASPELHAGDELGPAAGRAPRAPNEHASEPADAPPAPELLDILEREETIRRLLAENHHKERDLETRLLPELERRREEQAFLERKLAGAGGSERGTPAQRSRGPSAWGDFRRATPLSPVWGSDRGLCIDRYYIESFLERHADDIRGDVLEVHDSIYTRRYGGPRVHRADVIDIDPANPNATVVADLRHAWSLPPASYDCIILSQTLHVIYEMTAVAAECRRLLKGGGVLLATFPCVSRVDDESGLDGDFWRLSVRAARELFERAFPPANLTVRCHGNLLVSVGFLYGLAAHELTAAELGHTDPRYPLDVTLRAVAPS
jgi:hypothetical protein